MTLLQICTSSILAAFLWFLTLFQNNYNFISESALPKVPDIIFLPGYGAFTLKHERGLI